jgi:hypothetical protein
MALPLLDLVLPLLLLLLMCSSGTESYPLLRFSQRRSPSSIITTQRLDPAVESQDPGARPLPNEVAKQVNARAPGYRTDSTVPRGVPKPDRLDSGDGSAGGGGADRVSKVSSVISIHGASDPWGRPCGPTERRVIR